MAEDKRTFVAAIRDTRLRRAAMLIVVPILLAPLVLAVLWRAIEVAVEDAIEGWSDQLSTDLNSRALRALKLGLKQMWSKDWNTEQ